MHQLPVGFAGHHTDRELALFGRLHHTDAVSEIELVICLEIVKRCFGHFWLPFAIVASPNVYRAFLHFQHLVPLAAFGYKTGT